MSQGLSNISCSPVAVGRFLEWRPCTVGSPPPAVSSPFDDGRAEPFQSPAPPLLLHAPCLFVPSALTGRCMLGYRCVAWLMERGDLRVGGYSYTSTDLCMARSCCQSGIPVVQYCPCWCSSLACNTSSACIRHVSPCMFQAFITLHTANRSCQLA